MLYLDSWVRNNVVLADDFIIQFAELAVELILLVCNFSLSQLVLIELCYWWWWQTKRGLFVFE